VSLYRDLEGLLMNDTVCGMDSRHPRILEYWFLVLQTGQTSEIASPSSCIFGSLRLSIDPAILRRMPKRFPIRLPNLDQRIKILTLVCIFKRARRSCSNGPFRCFPIPNSIPISPSPLSPRVQTVYPAQISGKHVGMPRWHRCGKSCGRRGRREKRGSKRHGKRFFLPWLRKIASDEGRVSSFGHWRCAISSCTIRMHTHTLSRVGKRDHQERTQSLWTRRRV